MKSIVYTLASDSMHGREAGSIGEIKAKDYIVSYYKKIGLVAYSGSYLQKFSFKKDTQTDTAMNIIGMIDNKADSAIVIGAHYDHIGLGGEKSRSLTSSKIHPGADDNASGVAIMISLADLLKKQANKKYNFLFVAFSAEEEGLYGSEAFVNMMKGKMKVKAMFNLVMMGRLNEQVPTLKITRHNYDNKYDSVFIKAATTKFQLHITDENISYTDAGAFTNNGICALSFTTGMEDDYHKTSDTADKINYAGMAVIVGYLKECIDRICNPARFAHS
ncbi:MAG TPA: M20/M25/M40 family metallo-hydrolase [Bacteroidia bacterium]|nr:M20/M25/M40 family metallo-hydrolase [Bacteroidia bacterium]